MDYLGHFSLMKEELHSLRPEIEPYKTGFLRVSDLHTLYFEECGNPQGVPAIIIHGGPGGGSKPTMRRFHDPRHYRIILFDQRGCGKSTPHASLEENTTWHLVEDIEKLREHLGIQRWHVFGGSWGSTLSLAYAQTHPACVISLILRAVFTVRQAELDWLFKYGASRIFPEAWEKFMQYIPKSERSDLVAAYHRRLIGKDKEIRIETAKIWGEWGAHTLTLLENPALVSEYTNDERAETYARIECHYFINKGFLRSDDQLIADLPKIRHIPGIIVQGRYDICTPPKTAWDIKQAWPEADLRIVPASGHVISEPAIASALVAAAKEFEALRP